MDDKPCVADRCEEILKMRLVIELVTKHYFVEAPEIGNVAE